MRKYLDWETSISLNEAFAKSTSPSYLSAKNGFVYWVESLNSAGGRVVLKRRDQNHNIRTITPDGYSVRTRINEYGGRAYVVGNDAIYFCNDSDQCIYRQGFHEDDFPVALMNATKTGESIYFANLILFSDEQFLLFVMETENTTGNVTEIGFIETKGHNKIPRILCTGADFYASLSLSPNADQLAWIEWNHPNMPWDDTICTVADIHDANDSLALKNNQVIVENATASHVGFLENGDLILTIDWANMPVQDPRNYANLYQWRKSELLAITQEYVEYSYPHWIFGNHRYGVLNDQVIVAIATTPEGDELHLVNLVTKKVNRIAEEYCAFESVCVDNEVAYILAASSTQSYQIIQVYPNGVTQQLDSSIEPIINEMIVSRAQMLELTASSNGKIYANYYPPCNPNYKQPDCPPPLIVMIHGGPTARANNSFDVLKQIWTSSGYAILDVNHRGSSGFGRTYRDALLGQWGIADIEDVRDTILYVIEKGLAAVDAVFIRGKSAGGYVVQRALTQFPELFRAGASYYGIGNLATLTEITHKFESHYCNNLLGEVYDAKRASDETSRYFNRSPIHYMNRIKCPMILFQGSDDKVVPPALSEQVVCVLKQQGVQYEYHLYPAEGHGFRMLDSQVDSLRREMAFFRATMV